MPPLLLLPSGKPGLSAIGIEAQVPNISAEQQ
jgi:hypothetical protein